MKRWLSLILAAALAVCVFAACSKDDNTSGSAGKHHVEIDPVADNVAVVVLVMPLVRRMLHFGYSCILNRLVI